jgi:hypothetical protein
MNNLFHFIMSKQPVISHNGIGSTAEMPPEFEDLVKSKAYQEFLSWLQHENNLLLYV